MKKNLVFGIVLILVISMIFVSALSEIQTTETTTLNTKNGICEYYQKEFSVGEKESINVNGEVLNIEYLGNKNWKVNDYEGELRNHDFFVYNKESKLKGVRFDFMFMEQHQPEGNLGLTEQDYYPWDCQGYSQSTGLIKGLEVTEGWNLIPWDTSMRDCYYAYEGELCADDVLAAYYYLPSLGKYVTAEEIESGQDNPEIMEFFGNEENEFAVMESSFWIYVKPGTENKKLIGSFGAYIPYREKYLSDNVFKLSSGWNFLYVDAFMVYDDNWETNPLSLEDIEGDCTIEKAYGWNVHELSGGADWDQIDISSPFTEHSLGAGFIVKVSSDCALGYENSGGTTPPEIPVEGESDLTCTRKGGEIDQFDYGEIWVGEDLEYGDFCTHQIESPIGQAPMEIMIPIKEISIGDTSFGYDYTGKYEIGGDYSCSAGDSNCIVAEVFCTDEMPTRFSSIENQGYINLIWCQNGCSNGECLP